MTRSAAEMEQLVHDFQEAIKGEIEIGDFLIKREPPYSLFVIRHKDEKGEIPKALMGQWTDPNTAKNAINALMRTEIAS